MNVFAWLPANHRKIGVLAMLLCGGAPLSAFAQVQQAADRLSTRITALPATAAPAHVWGTDPSLELEQQQLKQSVLARLGNYAWDPDVQATAGFLAALTVTGRLLPTPSDAAALLFSPAVDFALTPRSQIIRQATLPRAAVLGSDATLCQAELLASASVESLVQACAVVPAADQAWVIQADGKIFEVLTGSWNRYADVLVAPGAWVWLPARSLAQDPALISDIARFLATQPLPASGASTTKSIGLVTESPAFAWRPLTSSNDWGETGLLQTPSARASELGTLRLTTSKAFPYTRMNVFLQPTSWLEFGFRYTDIATALYGPSIAGDQTYKDKSLDFKTVLTKEGAYAPQVALGMRDIGGTGLFSSEYLVASKRWESLDLSLGIGWGNMGTSGTVPNPLGGIFPALKVRQSGSTAQGGVISGAGMFGGDAALFGGVQWTSPSGQHVLKLELDGNDYSREPFGQNFGATSPFNVGWLHRISPGIDIGASFERGNRLAFALTFGSSLRTMAQPKPMDPPAIGLLPQIQARTTVRAGSIPRDEIPSMLLERLRSQINAQTGWILLTLDARGGEWFMHLETDDAVYAQDRLDRLFAVLATTLPAEGRMVQVELSRFGLPLRALRMDRDQWLAQRIYPDLPALQLPAVQWQRPALSGASAALSAPSRWESGWGSTFAPIFGGPNNFLIYQAGLKAFGQYRINESTWAFAQANFRLFDNYDTFVFDGPSNLPRVRTDQRSYVTTSRTTVPVAQVTRTFNLGQGYYASAYGGLLEPMYAGFGGEWLWRPPQKSWAVGVDVNQVQQRAFEQDLGFRDYSTTTGHATLYWDTGLEGVVAKISAGKYLAKDSGVTIDLSRSFANGTSIGVWATKTNVSAQQFGEGSFDKGIYWTIPFDAILPRSTPGTATIAWNPLTRDGGARLNRRYPLFDLTRHADNAAWRFGPASGLLSNRREADADAQSLLGALFPHRAGLPSLGESLRLKDSASSMNYGNLLKGTGTVLLTMALDQPIADAIGASSGDVPAASKAFSTIPYLLAAGVGTAALGGWGEDARSTAYASVSAATWALGTNLLGKSIIGRARPEAGRGAAAFDGVSPNSSKSSFASNHVAAAMALATPFAQRYDQPWLYGLVSLTALGRIQANEHWASDTLAGALVGYAFGTLALENQSQRSRGLAWNAGPGHISATYRY